MLFFRVRVDIEHKLSEYVWRKQQTKKTTQTLNIHKRETKYDQVPMLLT